ncbi:MAG: HEAT repeat domain-containing protein [Spirochaetes bacterium]|nr:HEAT repeat domain-containing protein [Spirochaetota bacterium]
MGLFGPNIDRLLNQKKFAELVKCLDNRRAQVRYGAFVALAGAGIADDSVTARLREMTSDPDPWVKTIATLHFTDRGDRSISSNIRELMSEGSRNARIALLRTIAGRGPDDDETVMEIIMDGLADRNDMVRRTAITAAGAARNRRLVPYVAELLHEKQHQTRIHAARALYDIGGEESIDHLIGLLADRHPEVTAAARSILEAVDSGRTRMALHDARFMQMLAGMNGTEPQRRAAAIRIGNDAARECLPLLHRACRDKYKGVRIEALKSIALFRDPSSADCTAKLLEDRFFDVRIEAVRALGQIVSEKSTKALETALNDRNARVRAEAETAVRRMKSAL